MKIFIIGVGLSESEIGTQQESFHHHRNIGKREISLLMGSGKLSGFGPLPHILSNISTNHEKQIDHEFIYLENKNHDSIEIVDGLAPIISENINFIESEGDYNWEALGNYLSKEDSESRALIIGTHTELDVLTTAHFLKNNTPLSRVATSPFLVGSATPEGHLSTLRHQLPNAGIEVLLDLEEVADFLNIELSKSKIPINRCLIEPEKIKEELNDAQKYIIETLCMHWSKVELRPLMGGFSGSLLFIANGWKDNAQAEPAVIKIDSFDQMRQEINGYHLVKDLLGKHIPTFAYPVSKDGYTGIAMELASMEGNPKTLQDIFEEATDDVSVNRFNKLLERSLTLLGSKLYGNTKELAWVAPYREFDLHTSLQVKFLEMNFEYIEKYLNDDGEESTGFDIDELGIILGMISKNEDGLNSEISLSHGDLNYANIICDNSDNVWFIDWTHTGYSPLELDFAKLENDTKFVMSKNFEIQDRIRFQKFQDYLLSTKIPAEISELPDALNFVKWDLRFRKAMQAIRQLRITCFDLKEDPDWLIYKIALLRYSLHNLSFDKRRGRGECELPSLVNALSSSDWLIFNLMADDFHLRIRSEKPVCYPERLRISIDEVPWALKDLDYKPAYFVDDSVLTNDCSKTKGAWADPEEFKKALNYKKIAEQSKFHDAQGRPLNPRGRTGLAGRGLLGKWGKNHAIALITVRWNHILSGFELLIGSHTDKTDLFELPKSFQLTGEDIKTTQTRISNTEIGVKQWPLKHELIREGYTYDPRQTDHAWVEINAYLSFDKGTILPNNFNSQGWFDEIKWYPLTDETINKIPSNQAELVRLALIKLRDSNRLPKDLADKILEKTG